MQLSSKSPESNNLAVEFYRKMFLIRRFEEDDARTQLETSENV